MPWRVEILNETTAALPEDMQALGRAKEIT